MKVQSRRVTMRQLCSLGLPAPILLPSLLPALRAIAAQSISAEGQEGIKAFLEKRKARYE